MDFKVFPLDKLIKLYGEDKVSTLLKQFKSRNSDVENFIKSKAVQFEKVGLSRTSLVFGNYNQQSVIVGFFSLSSKPLILSKANWKKISNSTKRKLLPLGYQSVRYNYCIPSILLGQISKNFSFVDERLTGGDELLELAYRNVRQAAILIGDQVLYLEAEDNKKINEFYTRNGFTCL